MNGDPVRIALTLGGTDRGVSGIGKYVRAVLPRLADRLRGRGGRLLALGTHRDLDAYGDVLDGAERVRLARLDHPAVNAVWHLLWSARLSGRLGADVLLLPAANRRIPLYSGVPTVAVVHDLANFHVGGKYDPLRMAYIRHLVTPAYRRADELVAISGSTRDDLAAALPGDGERVRVVPNGVDHQRFRPLAVDDPRVRAARQATGLTGPYLLYASRLEHPGKNHLRLVRAFARAGLDGHVLALVGSEWGAGPLIREEIARLGLGDRVRVLGYLDEPLIPALFAAADAVVVVGLHEGFGLPALEALACGRPVCASRSGALPEVVGTLAAFCDPLDEESIASALGRVARDAALRERSLAEGPAWAAAHGWDRTVDGLLEACRAAFTRSRR